VPTKSAAATVVSGAAVSTAAAVADESAPLPPPQAESTNTLVIKEASNAFRSGWIFGCICSQRLVGMGADVRSPVGEQPRDAVLLASKPT
jgi:hypothetical protein